MGAENDNNRLLNCRPLLAAAVGFMLGAACFVRICGVGLYGWEANSAFLSAAGIALPVIAGAAAILGAVRRSGWLFVVGLFFLFGAARVLLAAPDDITAHSVTLTGTVKSVEQTRYGVELTVRGAELEGVPLRYAVHVTVKNGDGSVPGQALTEAGERIELRCQSVSVPTRRYGAYNERLARLADGVSLNAYAFSEDISSSCDIGSPLLFLSGRAIKRIGQVIDRLYGDNSPLVSAFLTGQREAVSDEVYEDFVSGGVAHILTLSGFHVGLVTALLYRLIPKRYFIGRLIIIGSFLLVYCAVTGFSASLVRASVMCACALSANAVMRRSDPLSSLSLAALILLVVNPFKLYSAGFQLSFSAALGLLLVASLHMQRSFGRFAKGLLSAFTATLGAVAASMLFTARIFGSFYTYGIPANLVCIPLFSAAITLCFPITLLGLVLPRVAAVLAVVPNALINAALLLLGGIAKLPHARVAAFAPSILTCILMLTALFAASAYVLRPIKTRIKYAALVFALFTASAFADIIMA